MPTLYCISFVDFTECSSVAGGDTTAVSLTFALYYILVNRRIWERLSQEIRSRFHNPLEITGQSAATLTFLDAVIHEGNRFS